MSISLEFLFSNINFDEALLGLFPVRTMCHKIDSPNQPKSLVVYQRTGGRSFYLISLVVSEGHMRLSRLFFGNLPAMLSIGEQSINV